MKNKKEDWTCDTCGHFKWLIERKPTKAERKELELDGTFDFVLDPPKTKKQLKKANLYADAGMFDYEMCLVEEIDFCKKCNKKIKKMQGQLGQ